MANPYLLSLLAAGALKGGGWLVNKMANRGVDPNQIREQEILRRRGVTPQQYETSVRGLRQARETLESPQPIYTPQGVQSQFRQSNTEGLSDTISGSTTQAPLGGLSGRLQDIERAQFGAGYASDLGDIGAYMSRSNPMGTRSSGMLGLQKQAFDNRTQNTGMQQLGLVSDFAQQNALNELQGEQLQGLRSQIEGRMGDRISGLQGREQSLNNATFLSELESNRGMAGTLNTAANAKRRFANRGYQYGMLPTYDINALGRRDT